jgi:16S rRNA (cytidine1402-2'-O)-methyltransferase
MAKLFLVATPIGNLEDITFRAIRILKEVPLIAAEDTRTSLKLLNHYHIETPLTPYHDHNKGTKTRLLLDHLAENDLALISDAGTPAINDPGFVLVQAALQNDHQVIPIPGPSAPIAALSASGLPSDRFIYLGYLPRKTKGRRELLEQNRNSRWTLICLETPHRLLDALEDCLVMLGDREIVVGRELTKLHEEIIRGPISFTRKHFQDNPPKGEITLVIAGANPDKVWTQDQLMETLNKEIEQGDLNPSQLAKDLAARSGWSRKTIYDLMQDL